MASEKDWTSRSSPTAGDRVNATVVMPSIGSFDAVEGVALRIGSKSGDAPQNDSKCWLKRRRSAHIFLGLTGYRGASWCVAV